MKEPIRVLLAKVGLDGHDRGVTILALGLRDEGMEVMYTGIRQTPESVVETAIQEDVDVIGISCLTGGHEYYFPRVVDLLKEKGQKNVLVIGGGLVPEEDITSLKTKGIKEIFGPGTKVKEVADFIRANVVAS